MTAILTRRPFAILFFILSLYACGREPVSDMAPQRGDDFVEFATQEIDDQALQNADQNPGDWLSYGRNYSEDRYSQLDLINKENLDELGLAWTIELVSRRGVQATPLVVDGIMFFTGPWSVVYAVDARKGEVIWTFDPDVPREKALDLCCGVVNRGVAMYKGAVFVGTLDGRLISIDAATGEQNWSVMTVPVGGNYSITGAPRIANGKVLIGNGGAEYAGIRGFVSAYDAKTGEEVWRFYTVPGNPAEPFESPALEMAAETWTGEWWTYGGGGTAWDSIVFDPGLNSVYIGVGNGAHWDRSRRSPEGGDNLFLSSIVAVDADTGEYKWHYQTTPGDTWDYTATQPIILADLNINGEVRQVLMQAPKNGFFYVIDRGTGELISAEPYTYVNWASGIGEDGRPIEVAGARYEDGKTHWIAPSSHGGHNWFPMSYNHESGLVYIPGAVLSGAYSRNEEMPFTENGIVRGNELVVSAPFELYAEQVIDPNAPPPGTSSGELIAYDPVAQERVWAIPQTSIYNGGLLSTRSGLLMQGDAEGAFSIRDTDTGDVLWQFDVKSGVIASPVTYLVDGEQYITIIAEWGGGRGQLERFTDELYNGMVYTFKLGGSAADPEKQFILSRDLTSLTTEAPPTEIGWGFILHLQNCTTCHGFPGSRGGAIPNLAYSDDTVFDVYSDIVLDGAYAAKGMPTQDHLSERDVELIKSYVIFTAQSVREGQSTPQILQTLSSYQRTALENGFPVETPDTTNAEIEELETGSLIGDPEAGRRSAAICSSCHTFEKGGRHSLGPNLWGVFGRQIASLEGVNYSAGLTSIDGTWTEETLDAYLKAPIRFAPGTSMAVGAPRVQQRADIIAYLETLKDE